LIIIKLACASAVPQYLHVRVGRHPMYTPLYIASTASV